MSSTENDTHQTGTGTATAASVALAVREPTPVPALMGDAEINRTYRIATGLARSGMFKDVKQADQAFAKILLGRDLGLSPTQALTGIYIVEGKPEISANLQAQRVKTFVGFDGVGYDYQVVQKTDEACEIRFLRGDVELGSETFTIADATRAGLMHKDNWKKYPRNMLFARCMSNGVAFFCPEVMGGHRMYAEGEIGDGIAEPLAQPVEPVDIPDADATAEEEPAITDADVVADEGDELLTDEERLELVQAFEAAGVDDLTMFLTAAGFEQTDDLTRSGAFRMRELLGQHLQQTGAPA